MPIRSRSRSSSGSAHGHRRGEKHPRAQLPDVMVEEVRILHDLGGEGYKALARHCQRAGYACAVRTVRDIVNGARRR